MKKFETIIRIVTVGKDEFEAGEKAGELIDLTRMIGEEDILISCEPTRPFIGYKGPKNNRIKKQGSKNNALHGSLCNYQRLI